MTSLIVALYGCNAVTTSSRAKLEEQQAIYYEAAVANKDAQIEANVAALKVTQDKKIDYEVRKSVDNVRNLAAKDPVKYPPQDVAAEIARIYSVAENKKRLFAEAAKRSEAIRQRDEQTNLAYARKIRATLKEYSPPPPTDTTKESASTTGNVPPPPTLIGPGDETKE